MSSKATAKIHQQLADWVWQYFAAGADGSDNAKSTPTAILREPVRITGVLTRLLAGTCKGPARLSHWLTSWLFCREAPPLLSA